MDHKLWFSHFRKNVHNIPLLNWCWWRLFEIRFVYDKVEMLVTGSVILSLFSILLPTKRQHKGLVTYIIRLLPTPLLRRWVNTDKQNDPYKSTKLTDAKFNLTMFHDQIEILKLRFSMTFRIVDYAIPCFTTRSYKMVGNNQIIYGKFLYCSERKCIPGNTVIILVNLNNTVRSPQICIPFRDLLHT